VDVGGCGLLLISTAKHRLSELLELRGCVDGYELGIGYIKDNRRICSVLGEWVVTIHNLPALTRGEEYFMMEPTVNPEAAIKVAIKMVERVRGFLDDWKVYGVHAGLRGHIKGPSDFTVRGELFTLDECIRNIKRFYGELKGRGVSNIAIENIYGANEASPAVGADEHELRLISKVAPLLLDVGHLAVNCAYRNVPLESLNLKGLRIAEVHVSFLHPKIEKFNKEMLASTPMFWDHYPYVQTEVNKQILNVTSEIVSETRIATAEISGSLKEIRETLDKISFIREQ